MNRSLTLLAAVGTLGFTIGAGAASIPITSCDVTVPAGGVGVLQNDVAYRYRCTADPSITCSYNVRARRTPSGRAAS
ncbi:MAG: hypothetical protein FJ148_25815 [Deltaproteobacteria bacterium]|nr:hypothetical protein [Deltaproteobacteria bacterium]